MKKLLFVSIILSTITFSCNKDQKVVKELDGNWTVESRTYNGVAANKSEYQGLKYTFEACKLKDGDCDGSLSAPDSTKGTITFDFKYSISEKGTKFNLSLSLLGLPSETIQADILEHSKSKFVYSYLDQTTNSAGVTTTTTAIETLVKD